MENRPKPMGELEYLLMLTEIASEHGVTIKEVDAQMVQDMTDFWDNPKPEGRTWFRSLFPGLDRPPTPREAIPVLAVKVDEDLTLSGKHEKPR